MATTPTIANIFCEFTLTSCFSSYYTIHQKKFRFYSVDAQRRPGSPWGFRGREHLDRSGLPAYAAVDHRRAASQNTVALVKAVEIAQRRVAYAASTALSTT